MSRQLRQRLMKEFPTDQDFDAFCLDHYPQVKVRFAQTMDRVAKVNLLIEVVNNNTDIIAHLDEYSKSGTLIAPISRHETPKSRSRMQTKPRKGKLIDTPDPSPKTTQTSIYQPISHNSISLYRWCWQLTNWLRLIVYVELRASRVDWEEFIITTTNTLPSCMPAESKQISHMATPRTTSISYLTLDKIWSIIEDEANWPLFEPYILPYNNAKIRMDEIKLIVDRITNFREPHTQDKARLELFLRDVEPGLRQFCHRYTYLKRPSKRDPLTEYLHKIWPDHYLGIELECADGSWLYASGRYRFRPAMNASIGMLTHKLYKSDSPEGVIYALTFRPVVGTELDALRVLNQTKSFHKNAIHFFMFGYVTITIPAILGIEQIGDIICELLNIARGCSLPRSGYQTTSIPENTKKEWPEYVLWENHMLDLFNPEMNELTIDLSDDLS